jgi:tRNA (guanine37-N1)-methyltransferase
MFESPLETSILKIARQKGLIDICIRDLRDYTEDKHRTTDDSPYGGGAGMIMKIEPLVKAIEECKQNAKGTRVLSMTPQGDIFTQGTAQRLSAASHLLLICGRYEGVDERIRHYVDEEISIGDYILSGGELAAMVIIDAITRLIPGVVGDRASVLEDTFSGPFLKYPQYTRPRTFRGLKVPDILLSGDHDKIRKWRRQASLKKTLQKRPDLLDNVNLHEEDLQFLDIVNDHT